MLVAIVRLGQPQNFPDIPNIHWWATLPMIKNHGSRYSWKEKKWNGRDMWENFSGYNIYTEKEEKCEIGVNKEDKMKLLVSIPKRKD